MAKPVTAYLSLGSDMGDRRANLLAAVAALRRTPGIRVEKVSRFIRTRPVGMMFTGYFLNATVRVKTTLKPAALLDAVQAVELLLGRGLRPGRRHLPRPIDIDILFYGTRRIRTPRLTVPHPRMRERMFVLRPLAEILQPGV